MKKFLTLFLIPLAFGCTQTSNNKEQSNNEKKEARKRYFAEMEANALKEEYQGIFSDEGKTLDLFPIHSTGVSTEPIVVAAIEFLSSLTPEQFDRTTFDIEDDEWRKWFNVDNGLYDRQGMSLKEMNELQRKAAFDLMQASLSAKGLQLSKDIMKTDQTLKELNSGSADYGEELYFFTIMAEPSKTEPWGWQLDGHHLVINYFVLGDQIVMSPVFMGGEPIIATTGKYKENTLFQDEQNLGLTLMLSLSTEHQTKATISQSKTENNNVAEATKDNLLLKYEGLKVSEFTEQQRDDLLNLISQYINNIREGHQQVKMEEVIEHIGNTWFAWNGDTSEDAVFYYRIHGPVVLIEFDHQKAIGVPYENKDKPTRNHIHTVVRTPNGNDYGKDLLRQHLENRKH